MRLAHERKAYNPFDWLQVRSWRSSHRQHNVTPQSYGCTCQLPVPSWSLITALLCSLANTANTHPLSSPSTNSTSPASPPTRSLPLSDEDHQNFTSHNALKTNTTTKTFVGIFFGVYILFCICVAIAYQCGFFACFYCLCRADKLEEQQRKKMQHLKEADVAHRLEESEEPEAKGGCRG